MIRLSVTAILCAAAAAAPLAQLLPPEPKSLHVEIVDRSRPVRLPRGRPALLWAEVAPKPHIHVYAPGADGFDPITLVVSPRRGVTFGRPTYPAGAVVESPSLLGAGQSVPVYEKAFRVTLPITIHETLKAGETLSVSSVLKYQACDDRVCFPSESLPISWTVTVR
jgi:hypothetical protein